MSRKLTQRGSTLACIVVFLMLIASSFYHRCQSHCFLIFPEYPNRLTLETFQVSFIKQRIKTVFLVCKYWKDFVCHSRLDFRDLSETFNHTQTRSHNSFPSYHGDMWYLRKCQKASSFFCVCWKSWIGCVRVWKEFMTEKFLETLMKSVSHWGDVICDENPFSALRTSESLMIKYLAPCSVECEWFCRLNGRWKVLNDTIRARCSVKCNWLSNTVEKYIRNFRNLNPQWHNAHSNIP